MSAGVRGWKPVGLIIFVGGVGAPGFMILTVGFGTGAPGWTIFGPPVMVGFPVVGPPAGPGTTPGPPGLSPPPGLPGILIGPLPGCPLIVLTDGPETVLPFVLSLSLTSANLASQLGAFACASPISAL